MNRRKKYVKPIFEFENIEAGLMLVDATATRHDPENEDIESKNFRQFSLFDKNIVDEDEFDPRSIVWGE